MNGTLAQLVSAVGDAPLWLLVIKATVVAAGGLAVSRIRRHSRASARHLVLASTFAVLLVLPFAASVLPIVTVGVPVAARPSSLPSTSSIAVSSTPATSSGELGPERARPFAVSPSTVVLASWAAGAALFSTSFIAALRQLRRLRRTAIPWIRGGTLVEPLAVQAGIRRPVAVALHETVRAPLTCGVRRPIILLPEDAPAWSDAELRRAVVHELEHVRRRDWWVHLLARATCVFYWFHPLAWMAYRQLALDAERACDDAVMESEEATQYAEQLVELARRLAGTEREPALAMAARSDLSRRVSALLDARQARGRAGALRIGLVCCGALLVAIGVSPLQFAAVAAGAVVADAAVDQPGRSARRSGSESRGVSRGERALVAAAEDGDVEELRWLLEAGANVDAAVYGDGSPLIIAAREGHLAAVTLLLDHGADPNMGVEGDGSPLIMAAREGHLQIVELLLARGAAIDQVVPGDENALIQASGAGELDVVKLLVGRGADVNARVWVDPAFERPNGEWRTPLSQARRAGHRAVESFLRSAGAVE